MADSIAGRVLRLTFGEEGDVAADRVLQLLITLTGVSVAGVFVVSPIVSDLAGPFGVSEAAAGQLMTVFTAPSILLAPVMGVLADRVGRKPVLIAGLVLFGGAGVAIFLTTDFALVLALRALQGVGYAATIPLAVAVIGDLYTGSREATAQGLRVAGIQGMSFVVPPVAGALAVGSPRLPFLLFGLAIPVAAWAWLALPSFEPAGVPSLRGYLLELVRAVSQPVTALVMLSFALRFTLTFAFFAYASVLVARTLGGSAAISGLVVGVFGVTSMVAATQAGRLTDRYDARFVMVGGFVTAGGGLAALGVSPTLWIVTLSTAVFGVGAGITGPVQKSLVTQLADPSVRAGSVSSAVILQSVGQTVGPLAMGGLLAMIAVGGAFVVVGLVVGVIGVASMSLAYLIGGRAGALGPG